MEPHCLRRLRQEGSVLLVTLGVATIIGLILGSYLYLVQTQNLSVARSQSWNAGIAVAEAGVEEALAHLNSGEVFFVQANFATDGWLRSGNYVTGPQRHYLGSNYYDVAILTGTNPVIYATGYTVVPISGKVLSRVLQVTTAPIPLFSSAMVSLTNMSLNGGSMTTDSYDSNIGEYGQVPGNIHDKGDVVTDSNSADPNNPAIDARGATIQGRVRTGPLGLVWTNNSTSVGDTNWVSGKKAGIEPGWWVKDVNITLPDVQAPYTGGFSLPSPGTGNNPDYTLTGGDYYVAGDFPHLSGASKTNIFVTGGTNRLFVTGTLSVPGIIAIQTNSALTLFIGGTNMANPTSATWSTVNSDHAKSFQYYGLPNNNSVTCGGNGDFRGTIYAPEALLTVQGGGNGTNFCGTYYIYSASLGGHFNFHFDETLPKLSVYRGYIATSWQEL